MILEWRDLKIMKIKWIFGDICFLVDYDNKLYTLYFTASSQKYGYDKSLTCDGSECEVSEIEAYKPENILISR